MESLWAVRTLVDRVFGRGEVRVDIATSRYAFVPASTAYPGNLLYVTLTAYSSRAGKRIERVLPDSVNKIKDDLSIKEVKDFSPFLYTVKYNLCSPNHHFNKFLFKTGYLVSILDKENEVEG